MSEEHPQTEVPSKRERWIAASIVTVAVLLRSIVFVFWEQSYFDSDQAIVGLMAKHIAEGRAFPVFYYGQTYMLGVEAYLAAPVFLLAGVSVAALKFPLLLINIAVALVLLRMFTRDVGLRPYLAMLPVMFFALPAPRVAADILAPNGGNVAAFIYAVLIWLSRKHPVWCGLFAGVGFLHREFTIYAVLALFLIEAIDGTLWTRAGIGRRLAMLRTAAEVWLVVYILKAHSSAAGPGTSLAQLENASEGVLQFTSRFCTDPTMVPLGVRSLFAEHFPILFGTRPVPLADLAIQSTLTQGFRGSGILLALVVAIAAGMVLWHLLRERRWRPEYNACAFLVAIALASEAGYIVGRCGRLSYFTLRYELLSVLGLAGLGAWFLKVAAAPAMRRAWLALACGVVLVTTIPSLALLLEYTRREPDNPKRMMARHLEVRGIKYAMGDYWRAYALTFMTDERVIVAADDVERIHQYAVAVKAHSGEAVRIAREFCPAGKPVMEGLWICPY